MKFYLIDQQKVSLIPNLDAYKDKLVILTWFNLYDHSQGYRIGFEYDVIYPFRDDLLLFDLTKEDLTHLKLLGISLNKCDAFREIRIEDAVAIRRQKIVT